MPDNVLQILYMSCFCIFLLLALGARYNYRDCHDTNEVTEADFE